ncbi:MAG: RNA methyltransferase [Acidobacteriota bacterium]|jgi:tRNA/rRNA methyltransferase|nr:RNA methyltransferase [Acidobacteriota bacterium]
MKNENIAIILAGTKYPGNIGSTARAMFNMGLTRLILADPKCAITEESYRLAKSGKGVLDSAKTCRSLKSALRGIHFLVGTTGKSGGYRSQVYTPRSLAPKILSQAEEQKVGILFGPEDTGLVDEDLKLCQLLIRIPTQQKASSLNLSQAVLVLCYELFLASLKREPVHVLKLASVEQAEAMYDQLENALLQIGFLHPQNSRHMMLTLRRMLGRAGLESSDVGVLRGIARQIRWYAEAKSK